MMRTTYTITGTLVGAYWWPMGQVWTKSANRTYTRDEREHDRPFGPDLMLDVPRLHDRCPNDRPHTELDACKLSNGRARYCPAERPQRLRLALESLTRDADSSNGVKVAYGELAIRRDRGARETVRRFPLSMFPSIADYLTADVPDYAPDGAEDI